MPELGEEKWTITAVTANRATIKLLHLITAEAVAKFSSFRQLRVSTINTFSAVTRVTFGSDADQ
jgi:hypothetical protein